MAEIDKILRLVADGALSAQEADEIIAALDSAAQAPKQVIEQRPPAAGGARQLRIEVTDGGRHVVNLRVPLNIAGWASAILPGLSDTDSDRIRGAVASGTRGPILDITDNDGSRVLITSE